MKNKFPLTMFLIAVNIWGNAQGDFEFLSSCNYLSRDVSTQIKLIDNGKVVNPNNYQIHIDNGSYTKNDSAIFVDVTGLGKPCITVMKTDSSIIAQQCFSVQVTPTFKLTIDGWEFANNIDKSVLLRMVNVVPYTQSPPEIERRKLMSYNVILTIGNERHTFRCNRPEITDSLRAFFTKIKACSNIEFIEPVIQGCNRQIRSWDWGPVTNLEVNGYDTYLQEYCNLFFDFKKYTFEDIDPYDTLRKHFVPYWQDLYYNFDRIIETNCNSSNDTCTTSLFYIVNGIKQLALNYYYMGNDIEKVELYNNNIRIAEMDFLRNRLSGYFNINFPDGRKKEEGYYRLDGLKVDTFTYVNSENGMYQNEMIEHEREVKSGSWKFYNEGNFINEIIY